ncbi:hypothetical protein DAPPUDRAFT_332490 [Daphnia pulex]|uniref:Uncharacterized protein n=1 Tax=Daphnia pulex TaxID=6669 RepID=E9HQ42_DAPPU|nr:hypothetical protein DAPPUDRAFT_332490 [Daphnia pulex]|eukprot:EFX66145.1 hypothetical protein DAPPUDRAFT_332490 [Daphnia pulex]
MEMGDGSLAEPNFPEQFKCILHLGEDTSEPVKKFSQKMLDNCRQKALVYKFRKTCNYEIIVIPEVISDTVAIQNIPDKEEAVDRVLSEPEYEDTTVSGTRKRRRRTFVARDIDIAPYHKKPSMSDTMLVLEDERRQLKQETIKPAKKLDLLWMVSHYVNKPDTPMWVGFNSQLIVNKQPKQRICYLPQIEASPTRTDPR